MRMGKARGIVRDGSTHYPPIGHVDRHRRIVGGIDAVFYVGLLLMVGAACVANLRITPSGPRVMLQSGGYPFLYEVGFVLAALGFCLRLGAGIPRVGGGRRNALIGLNLFNQEAFAT